jgi:hypothetical protein
LELAVVILDLKDAETGETVTGASVNFINCYEGADEGPESAQAY